MSVRTHEVFSDKLAMTFLKIPLMAKGAERCKDTLDRWLYILKHMDKMDTIPTSFMDDPVFRRLGEVARIAVLDEQERRDYEKSLKTYRDNYAIAMTERSEGFAEGEAKGRAEGRAEGIAEGEAKGRSEEKLAIARNLISLGLSDDSIAAATGLQPGEIAALR